MSKLSGIALLDALIGIVLSTLVILSVFMVVRSNFNTYFQLGRVQQRVYDAGQIRFQLQMDTFLANEVSFESNSLVLKQHNAAPVYYDFTPLYTLRRTLNYLDTLPARLTGKKLKTDTEIPRLLNCAELHFSSGTREFSIVLDKRYPASTYMSGKP